MRQPQKNLFFSYRGALLSSSSSDLVFDRQLEDNATKALIYVLENANRDRVLEPFLREIVGLSVNRRLDDVQFALQRVDIARPFTQRRVALSIAPIADLAPGHSGPHNSGRPDAWIWSDDSFAILLETKVHGQASREQLRRHIAAADGWRPTNVRLRPSSWSEIYEFFPRIR